MRVLIACLVVVTLGCGGGDNSVSSILDLTPEDLCAAGVSPSEIEWIVTLFVGGGQVTETAEEGFVAVSFPAGTTAGVSFTATGLFYCLNPTLRFESSQPAVAVIETDPRPNTMDYLLRALSPGEATIRAVVSFDGGEAAPPIRVTLTGQEDLGVLTVVRVL